MIELKTCVRRSVTMTTASADQTTYFAFTSRIQQAFLWCRLLAQHILLACALQKETGATRMMFQLGPCGCCTQGNDGYGASRRLWPSAR
jgi:hypothetical protein